MKTAIFLAAMMLLFAGCPADNDGGDDPTDGFASDTSSFEVIVGGTLGQPIKIGESQDHIFVPQAECYLWVHPSASVDGEAVAVSVKSVALDYDMIAGADYNFEWSAESSSSDGGVVTGNHPIIRSVISPLLYPYRCYTGTWWNNIFPSPVGGGYVGGQWFINNGYYWVGDGWSLRPYWGTNALIKDEVAASHASQLGLMSGKWLRLQTAVNQISVSYTLIYSVNELDQAPVFGRVWLDNDGDGVTNADEIDYGTDPNDPDSYPGQTVAIPDLSGMTVPEATDALNSVGLYVGDQTLVGSTMPAGQVVSWSPVGSVARWSSIDLNVSTGPALPPVQVPDLTGLTESQASTAITAVGLAVGSVNHQASNTIPLGIVISWSPTGTVVSGTAISLVVSSGPSGSEDLWGEITSPTSGVVLTAGVARSITIEYGGGSGSYTRVQLFSELDGKFVYTAEGWQYIPEAITGGSAVKIWLIVQDTDGDEVRDSIDVTCNAPS